MQTEIGIVIPVFNNQLSLRELDKRIKDSLPEINYRVLYVNDGSTDDSAKILAVIEKENEAASFINLTENIGQQHATLEGIKRMESCKIVVLDADLQDKPELIFKLYENTKKSTASGFIKRKGMYQSYDRMITSIFIKLIVQLLSGLHRKAGSFYIFDCGIKQKVVALAENCSKPYLSIIVASSSSEKKYISYERGTSSFGSNYNTRKRIKAARAAISCALFCRLRSKHF